MNKWFWLYCFLFIGSSLYGQQYSYKNSFEEYSRLPMKLGDFSVKSAFNPSPDPKASPDYYHKKAKGEYTNPSKVYYGKKVQPVDGNGIIGFISYLGEQPLYREYVGMKIPKLTIGKEYIISFYVRAYSKGINQKDIGLHFSKQKLIQNGHEVIKLKPTTKLAINETNNNEWEFRTISFTADSAYMFLTLGNFSTEYLEYLSGSIMYYYIDLVEIKPRNNYPMEETSDSVHVTDCGQTIDSGSYGVYERKINLGASSGKFELSYDMKNIPDKIIIYCGDKIIYRKKAKGSSKKIIFFDEPFIRVVIEGSTKKTIWSYKISCPIN